MAPFRDYRLMVKVARLHYEKGLRQTVIAERLNLSAAKVSRVLKRAEEEGVVKTVVTVLGGIYPELEEGIEERFGLAEVLVVDVSGDSRDVLPALAAAGAEYLHRWIEPGSVLGISAWSETLAGVSQALRTSEGTRASAVVQLVGGSGPARAQMASAEMLARFSRAFDALPIMVPAPGVAGDPAARQVMMRDPSVAEAVSYWDQCDIAMVGIGGLHLSPALRRSGNYSEDEARRFAELGSVGDICLRHFDDAGRFVTSGYDDRIIGISPADLMRIPRRVGVAGGSEKADAIRALLRSGVLTSLITDSGTARQILG